MKIYVLDDAQAVAKFGAGLVKNYLIDVPDATLGLATGSTPLGLYRQFIDLYQNREISFAEVKTFNLDEYIGLAPEDRRSYCYYMANNLFRHIDIVPSNTHVPTCLAETESVELGLEYEGEISRSGGIGLQVLGIGRNGHVGFNEPTSSFASRTRMVKLTSSTIAANRPHFVDGESQPDHALTIGIGTILEAKRIVLLATGTKKSKAVSSTIEGPLTASCPASALQLHANTTMVLDVESASDLQSPEYYVRVRNDEIEHSPSRKVSMGP